MDNKETDKSQMNGSMKDMNQLHLEKITYLNWHDVEDLRLTKEQKNYLPDNVRAKHVYEKCGFRSEHRMLDDEELYKIVLD